MPEKRLEDYTIKEIYENFDLFKNSPAIMQMGINEKSLSRIIGNNNATKQHYMNVKFVQFLKEYENGLKNMPYMENMAPEIINEILENVQHVSLSDLSKENKIVSYDDKNKSITFDMNTASGYLRHAMTPKFTEIAYNEKFSELRAKGFSQLDKLRTEYISAVMDNYERTGQYEFIYGIDNPRVKLFRTLCQAVGEKEMLEFGNYNIPQIEKTLKEKYNINLSTIERMVNYYSNPNREKLAGEPSFNEWVDKVKKIVEDRKEPTEIAKTESEKFYNILDTMDEFPQNMKEQMKTNVYRGVKDIENVEADQRRNGTYYSGERKIALYDNKGRTYKTTLHEFFHAATTARDGEGNPTRVGFKNRDLRLVTETV